MVEAAGFGISKVVEDRFTYRFLDGSAMLRHWLVRIGFLDAWRSVVDRDDEQKAFTMLEERLNEVAHDKGELRMTIPMLYVEARPIV